MAKAWPFPGVKVSTPAKRKDGSQGPARYYHRKTGAPLKGKAGQWLQPDNPKDVLEAAVLVAQLEEAGAKPKPPSRPRAFTLGALLDYWQDKALLIKRNGKPVAEGTRKRARSTCANIPGDLLNQPLARFSVASLGDYKRQAQTANKADKFNRELATIQRAFRWAETQVIEGNSRLRSEVPQGLGDAIGKLQPLPHAVKHYEAWPPEVLRHWVDMGPPEFARLVRFQAAIGLRVSDGVRVTNEQIRSGVIRLEQKKTGGLVSIPLARLGFAADILERVPAIGPDGARYLTSATGRPWNKNTLAHAFAYHRENLAATAPRDLQPFSLHGLRANATVGLLEAGVPADMVRAITGHASPSMVAQYGRDFFASDAGEAAAAQAVNFPKSLGALL